MQVKVYQELFVLNDEKYVRQPFAGNEDVN